MSWWSDKYSRPLKDPILLSYTTEELAYEYYLSIERAKAESERIQAESDKIEEAKLQEDDEWADKMEAEEAQSSVINPLLDQKNIDWMQQEIEKNKQELGEDFGDDLSVNFEGT